MGSLDGFRVAAQQAPPASHVTSQPAPAINQPASMPDTGSAVAVEMQQVQVVDQHASASPVAIQNSA